MASKGVFDVILQAIAAGAAAELGHQDRAEELLDGLKNGHLSAEDRRELDQFEQAERLMRLVKARIQAGKARRP